MVSGRKCTCSLAEVRRSEWCGKERCALLCAPRQRRPGGGGPAPHVRWAQSAAGALVSANGGAAARGGGAGTCARPALRPAVRYALQLASAIFTAFEQTLTQPNQTKCSIFCTSLGVKHLCDVSFFDSCRNIVVIILLLCHDESSSLKNVGISWVLRFVYHHLHYRIYQPSFH